MNAALEQRIIIGLIVTALTGGVMLYGEVRELSVLIRPMADHQQRLEDSIRAMNGTQQQHNGRILSLERRRGDSE